jgi:hypothetical protein
LENCWKGAGVSALPVSFKSVQQQRRSICLSGPQWRRRPIKIISNSISGYLRQSARNGPSSLALLVLRYLAQLLISGSVHLVPSRVACASHFLFSAPSRLNATLRVMEASSKIWTTCARSWSSPRWVTFFSTVVDRRSIREKPGTTTVSRPVCTRDSHCRRPLRFRTDSGECRSFE